MLSQDYCSKLREQLEESTERASEVAKMEILGSAPRWARRYISDSLLYET